MDTTSLISSGILELYATGLSSEKEAEKVKQYLQEYPEIAAELESISTSLEVYTQNFWITPAPYVKENILALVSNKKKDITPLSAVENPAGDRVITGVSPYWRMAATASILLLTGSSILQLINYNKYSAAKEGLASVRQALTSLQEKDRDIEKNLDVVQSKYSVPIILKGLETAPGAAAKIFWMKNTGEVFIDARNLPVAPAGRQYQLWGIVDGKPVDAGMLLKIRQGNISRMQKMKSFGKAEAFAITLEPENGSLTPQGPMYLMGKM